jgi:hypothetical protein
MLKSLWFHVELHRSSPSEPGYLFRRKFDAARRLGLDEKKRHR